MKKIKMFLFLVCFFLFMGFCSVFNKWLSFQQTLHENPSSEVYEVGRKLTKEEMEIQALYVSIYNDWEELSSFFGYLSLYFVLLLILVGVLIWIIYKGKSFK